MSENITIARLERDLAFFRKMYDVVRLVDPVNKTVLEYGGVAVAETGQICFDYWERGGICDNCISIRAHMSGKCYQKLDQTPEAYMLVTALPLENAGRPVILELLRNASDTMLIGSGLYSDGQLIRSYVSEMNDLVVRDGATGLYNRRYVDERLPADIVKARLEGRPLSILFIDVDNLKNINDACGHAAGDRAIVEVASAVSYCIRAEADWAARHGGDEFLACLNNTGGDDAHRAAERIRRKIAEIRVSPDEMPVTASLGIYTLDADSQLAPDEIIALADKRKYEAKQQGRNRIVFH